MITVPKLRRTAIDISLTFGRQFLAGLMHLGLVLIVARLLGPEGAGGFAVALLLPTLMSQFLNLGLGSANVYFVASRQFSLTQAWTASRDLMLLMAVLGLAVGATIVLWLGEKAFPGVPESVLLAALLIYPFSLLAGVVAGLFQALQDFRAYNFIVIIQPGLTLLGVGVLWLVSSVNLVAVLLVVSLSHALALVVALALLGKRTSLAAFGDARMDYLRPAMAYGIKAHLGNIISFLNYRLDLFLVNLLVGPAAAGLYTVAVRLVEQLWMFSQAFSTVIFPRLSAMINDELGRRSLTPVMTRLALWISLMGAGVLAILAQPIIRLLFGESFLGAAAALLALMPGVVMFSGARVLAADLAGRGKVGINLLLAILVLIVNTWANLVFIPAYGILGAAVATALAYSLSYLCFLIIQTQLTKSRWWTLVFVQPEDISRVWEAIKKRRLA